ncbi:putative methyltransferase DDB_G0268948 [Pollicipes pollicipes]|uniref:putative methyltransferase DDB_G0268948 n=1 Tax=Pollicipes pollicipes TaxID=41117 RepID=UPI0018858841|nr:putative methyltransferase DDB_G0268948 [Pollicipes pollicipes]
MHLTGLEYPQEKLPLDRALDVGCGSGQNTRCLATHFRSVLATDISLAQIKEATVRNTFANIEYQVSAAEEMPMPAESVQLVTACTCCHYFDMPRFFAEADRVLAPDGIIAIYSLSTPKVYHNGVFATELNRIWMEARETIGRDWGHIRKDVEDRYSDPRYQLPYPGEVRDESHYQEQTLTLDGLLGFIRTLSSFQTMVNRCGAERGETFLQQTRERFHAVFSNGEPEVEVEVDDVAITLRFPYFLLMARKPVSP